MLALLVFGSIQACNMLYLRHALISSAYHGTLAAAKQDATTSSIVQQVQAMLDAQGVKNSSITINRGNGNGGSSSGSGIDYSAFAKNTIFTIRVTAPISANLMQPHMFAAPDEVVAEVVSMK